MNRRWIPLAGALAVTLAAPQAVLSQTASAATPAAAPQRDRRADADQGLSRLRADATGKLRVHRSADGVVDFVSSTDGGAMVEAPGSASPSRAAADQLARYGEAFGLGGATSRTVVTQTIPSATGGSVVRADQVVDGVPVFGGQVVMSLDEEQRVVSVDAATTSATEVPAAAISEVRARSTALGVTAKYHRTTVAKLTVTDKGRRLFDPALVHTTDPRGTRPVWQFEVGNGFDVRETVLVGTDRGEIALHFNDAPGINRVVCDNADGTSVDSDDPAGVPLCTAPARAEGGNADAQTDVNAAYDNLGAVSATYDSVAGIDLTDLIGTGTPKRLMSTVRWCFSDLRCPYENAFWNGTQMVFGEEYAVADDVVGHELTHGYVERTSALFSLHQSAAINESVADVVGEVVDHRSDPGPEDNSDWTIGEDIPGAGAIRSLKDPPIYGQPDKMTSPAYQTADALEDGGAVHQNDGVGNKTAYLISQGGSFNGRTVAGIDGSDNGLTKTGLLYLEVIPRLTSGSEYADLGQVLAATCDELVASSAPDFTAADCTSVRNAVLATELATAPLDPDAAAPEAAVTCPTRYFNPVAGLRDDDSTRDFGVSYQQLWQRTPDNQTPSYAHSGRSSWFGWDPDPDLYGDPTTSVATLGEFQVPAGRATILSFHHAYLFEFAPADADFPAEYYDGGQVLVQTSNGDGTWTTQGGLPWKNGPNRALESTPAMGFGGDSHGYGSSTVDLTSLGGRNVRVLFKVVGDETGSYLGWFVDDIRLTGCASRVPGGANLTSVRASGSSVALSWTPPAYAGSGVSSYRIVTSSGVVKKTVPASARSTTITGLNPGSRVYLSVRAVNAYGEVSGAYNNRAVSPSRTTTTSVAKVKKNKPFTVTARVQTPGGPWVKGMPVVLQSRLASSSVWRNVITGSTDARGIKAWSVRQKKPTYYRVVSRGAGTSFGSTSAARLVKKG